jgi:hypothetical protein
MCPPSEVHSLEEVRRTCLSCLLKLRSYEHNSSDRLLNEMKYAVLVKLLRGPDPCTVARSEVGASLAPVSSVSSQHVNLHLPCRLRPLKALQAHLSNGSDRYFTCFKLALVPCFVEPTRDAK